MADKTKAKFLYFKTNSAYENAKSSMANGAIAFDAQNKHIYVKANASNVAEYYIGNGVIDNLTSTDASAALSAKQGNILYELITNITGDVSAGDANIGSLSSLSAAVTTLQNWQSNAITLLETHTEDISALEVTDTSLKAAIVAVAKACAANELENYYADDNTIDTDNTIDIKAGSVNASTVDGSIMNGVTKAQIKVRLNPNGGLAQDTDGIYVNLDGIAEFTTYKNDVSGQLKALNGGISTLNALVGDTSVTKQISSAIDTEASARAAADASEASARAAADTTLQANIDTINTKLSTIESNAEKNIIEVVKVNSNALTVDTSDRSVNISVPVTGVKSGDKILRLDGADGRTLETGLSLTYDTSDGKKYIRLRGLGDEVISYIDCTAFIKDGMLSSAELVTKQEDGISVDVPYIKLQFNADSGGDVIRLSVKSLVDTYTVDNDSSKYLSISDYKVKALVDTSGGLASYAGLSDVSRRVQAAESSISSIEESIDAIDVANTTRDNSINRVEGSVNTLLGDVSTAGSIAQKIYNASTTTKEDLIGKDTDTSVEDTIKGAKRYADWIRGKAVEDVSIYVSITGDNEDKDNVYISPEISAVNEVVDGKTIKTITGSISATTNLKNAVKNANSAIQTVKVNGDALKLDASDASAVNITVGTGTANGTISVNNKDVSVAGLKSAAFTDVSTLEEMMGTKDVVIKNDLIGDPSYGDSSITIYGARKYTDSQISAAFDWYIEA